MKEQDVEEVRKKFFAQVQRNMRIFDSGRSAAELSELIKIR